MAGRGARAGRRLRRQIKLGRLVSVISFTENGEMLSCGHEGPRGLERQCGPGIIMRHCLQCPPIENS